MRTEPTIIMEKLENTNQDFELLLENVECGICVLDVAQGNNLELRYMSRGYCRLCEGTTEEIEKAFAQDKMFGVCEEDRHRVHDWIVQIINEEVRGEITYQGKTLKGTEKWCTLHLVAVRQSEQQLTLYATFYDVTEQMQNEEKLRESEQTIEIATDQGGIWYWRYEWRRDVLHVGKKVQREFNLPEEVKDFSNKWRKLGIVDKAYLSRISELIEELRDGAERSMVDVRIHMPDGTQKRNVWR